MSTFTEIRDNVVGTVTEELKQEVSRTIIDEFLPIANEQVSNFVNGCKEDSKNENGWCKLRDGVILPLVLNTLLRITRLVLTKSLSTKE